MFHLLPFPGCRFLYCSHLDKHPARALSCCILVVVEVDTESCVETSVFVEVERKVSVLVNVCLSVTVEVRVRSMVLV